MRLFLTTAVCLVSFCAAAESYTAQDIEFKNQLFYDKSGNKITGDVIKNYPNGQKFAHFKVKDGKSQESELYYPNGKLKNQEMPQSRIEYWPNGNKRRESIGNRLAGNDVRKFYTGDGRLLIEAPFKNNQIDGIVKIYADNKRLEEERPYARVLTRTVKTDKGEQTVQLTALHGVGKLYDADKKITATTDYDKGVVKKITHFDAAGNKLPTVVNNDVKAFDENTCKVDGKAFSGAMIINAVEPQVQFFEVPCRGGMIDGIVRVYVGAYGTYGRVYDNIPYKNGKKDGIARVYSYSDLLLSGEVPYKNDIVDGVVREYHPTGELMYETPYKAGQMDGVRKVYGSAYANPTGDVLLGEFPYTNGQLNGIATLYNTLGDVQKKITYLFGKEVFTKAYQDDKTNAADKTAKASTTKDNTQSSTTPSSKSATAADVPLTDKTNIKSANKMKDKSAD